jgi:ABC-type polysaccharide/polyol phosphate transport system ATPase subunit
VSQGRIEVAGLWKKFRRGEVHDSLRDLVPALARRLVGRGPRPGQLQARDFWALKDVSFTVDAGQTLGVIGPNGAGKSTLLKLLTGILRPDRGWYRVQGRIGALIEVAAGFHPDLTGRENIYLQGSIMGMRQAQIDRFFDAIVDFSGIAEALDTPVKRYSSGMNARLGFSIAAHLDPDVLIIDEVLAVGDLAFQARAFARIRELAVRDIPVVVVSHQLDRVASLCTDCVLLDHGAVVRHGSPIECIAAYVSHQTSGSTTPESCPVELTSLRFDSQGPVRSGDWARLTVSGRIAALEIGALEPVGVRVIATSTGETLFASSNTRCGTPLAPGPFELEIDLQMNLAPGIYLVETVVWDQIRETEAARGPSTCIEVVEGVGFYGTVQLNLRLRLRERTEPARSQ